MTYWLNGRVSHAPSSEVVSRSRSRTDAFSSSAIEVELTEHLTREKLGLIREGLN